MQYQIDLSSGNCTNSGKTISGRGVELERNVACAADGGEMRTLVAAVCRSMHSPHSCPAAVSANVY